MFSIETEILRFIYAIVGLIVGSSCVFLGATLFYRGVKGATSWTAKVLGFESEISDAGPGLIIALIGLLIVFITRF